MSRVVMVIAAIALLAVATGCAHPVPKGESFFDYVRCSPPESVHNERSECPDD